MLISRSHRYYIYISSLLCVLLLLLLRRKLIIHWKTLVIKSSRIYQSVCVRVQCACVAVYACSKHVCVYNILVFSVSQHTQNRHLSLQGDQRDNHSQTGGHSAQ